MTPEHLRNMIHREQPPAPWSVGEKIPWNDPAFSARMLREHLDQTHDAASRRFSLIDEHVAWLHEQVLGGRPARVLDLGCGPGFYASRMAALGHEVHGFDFSPASIEYARANTQYQDPTPRYTLADIRTATFGDEFDLAMLIFGEFNVFTPDDARGILRSMHAALKPGGIALLEPHTFAAVEGLGMAKPYWYTTDAGLFSDMPHVVLYEAFWDAPTQTATERYFIVDAATQAITQYGQTAKAYTPDGYRALLAEAGFVDVQIGPGLRGADADNDPNLCMVLGTRAHDG